MKQKLILIDEIDGISGTKDRGGIPTIIKIVENTSFPIILTVANPYDNKFSKLKRRTDLVEFAPLTVDNIYDILKKICKHEKIVYEDDVLKGLARRAGNDARAALNDLQTLSIEANKLTKESLEELGERNKTDTMITALLKIFKTTDPNIAISAFETVKEDVDEQFMWVDENLPHEYKNVSDRATAYDRLSKADVFRRRIRRWQHWRFLIYINALITAGIATAKTEKYTHQVKVQANWKNLKAVVGQTKIYEKEGNC